MAEEWSAGPENVIRNCFVHRFKQCGMTETENCVQDDEEETIGSMGRDVTERGVLFMKIGLQHLLNRCGENDVIEILSVKMQGREVVVIHKIFELAVELEDIEGVEKEEGSPEVQLKVHRCGKS